MENSIFFFSPSPPPILGISFNSLFPGVTNSLCEKMKSFRKFDAQSER